MGHDNDYSITVFYPEGEPKKWGFVHKINGFAKFLGKAHPGWKYMNVYNRRSGKFLVRFYSDNNLPDFI